MLLAHGMVLPMTAPNRIIADGAVFVRDGLIADVGTAHELTTRYSDDAEVLDARGRLILPGSICSHTHFYGAFARGMAIPGQPATSFVEVLERLWWKLDRALDPEAVRYSTLVCLADAIRHGMTTLIDHHASPSAIEGSLDTIAGAVQESGLRAALCYEVTDRNGHAGALAGIDENIRFARAGHNHPSPNIRSAFGIHALFTVGDDTLDRCVAAAREAGVPLHLHVAEGQADQTESLDRYHLRVIERLVAHGALTESTICAHCIHIEEHEILLLADHAAKVTHQPRSNMNNAVGVAPVLQMLRAGVCVGLGNDGFSNNAFTEMKFADLLQRHAAGDPRVIGAEKVMGMAYANNSQIAKLFWQQPVGTIEVGAFADLVLADYQPFTPLDEGNLPWHMLFGMDGSEITDTICAGRVLMRDRQLLTLDEAAIAAKSREIAERVWARVRDLA